MPPNESRNRRQRWWPLAILAAILLAWALVLGIGAYIEWGDDDPQRDPRKFWIVLGCMLAFLAVWGTALWLRSRRDKAS